MKKPALKFMTALFLLTMLATLVGIQPVYAAGIVVSSTADVVANNSLCTLREAITNAIFDNQSGSTDCAAGAGNDTITLPAGTYTLGSQLPMLTANAVINIVGAGAATTIIQANAAPNTATYRIFYVYDATLSISGVTLQNGACNGSCAGNQNGGAIYNALGGTLTISNSIIANNTAAAGGGVFSQILVVTNTTFSGNTATTYNGGGIANNAGNLSITNSTFLNNSAPVGGGVANFAPSATIANSTFTGNSGTIFAGAIFNGTGGTLTAINNTISANTSPSGSGIYNNINATLHLKNNILANGITGADCFNAGGNPIATNIQNLIETNGASVNTCGTPALNSDPMLNTLANNGGATHTFALLPGSPANDAGDDATCAAAPVNHLDQRGIFRPRDLHCDIGSFESDAAPVVTAITRASAASTSALSVDYTVTFSESVTGVDIADFSLSLTGITGASLATVTPVSGNVYTVNVLTGSGNGTLRLDVNASGTNIQDLTGNPLNGGFTGEVYNVKKKLTVRSSGAQDGWVLEAGGTSSTGGTMDSASTTLRLGDETTRGQYRSLLSFNTASLPDTAVITKVTLKVRRQGVIGGGNPVNLFQGFMVDIRKGTIGTAPLQLTDWQAAISKILGPFNLTPLSGWYTLDLTPGKGAVNKLATGSGLTQIRLRFQLQDNGDFLANFLSLYSGNAGAGSRPQLIIEYYVP